MAEHLIVEVMLKETEESLLREAARVGTQLGIGARGRSFC